MKNTLSIFKDTSGETYGYRIFSGTGQEILQGDGYKTVAEITTFFDELRNALSNLTVTVKDKQE